MDDLLDDDVLLFHQDPTTLSFSETVFLTLLLIGEKFTVTDRQLCSYQRTLPTLLPAGNI